MNTTRALIKHTIEPTTYAVEIDADGMILSALDVTTEATSGGLCPHLLETLPLAAAIDDVERLNRTRDAYSTFVPDCANAHHLLSDLVKLESEHRTAIDAFAAADARAKSAKKRVDETAAEVHQLLGKIRDRKPLPLFEGIAGH